MSENESKKNEKELVDDTVYHTYFKCRNCGEYVSLVIPKKTRVSDFIKEKRCPNCECKLR